MNRFSILSISTLLILGGTFLARADESVENKKMHEIHMQMMENQKPQSTPTQPGQEAFGTVQEIVKILEADPNTDWSKVDLENLRQHLIGMNEVVLNSNVTSTKVPSGLSMEITGRDRTLRSIQSMVIPHSEMLNKMPQWSAQVEKIPTGVRLVVKAKNQKDEKTIAKIRALGFIGLLVQGAHHQIHHLAMARGERAHDHRH